MAESSEIAEVFTEILNLPAGISNIFDGIYKIIKFVKYKRI